MSHTAMPILGTDNTRRLGYKKTEQKSISKISSLGFELVLP